MRILLRRLVVRFAEQLPERERGPAAEQHERGFLGFAANLDGVGRDGGAYPTAQRKVALAAATRTARFVEHRIAVQAKTRVLKRNGHDRHLRAGKIIITLPWPTAARGHPRARWQMVEKLLCGHSEPFAVILRSAADEGPAFPPRAGSAKNLLVIESTSSRFRSYDGTPVQTETHPNPCAKSPTPGLYYQVEMPLQSVAASKRA